MYAQLRTASQSQTSACQQQPSGFTTVPHLFTMVVMNQTGPAEETRKRFDSKKKKKSKRRSKAARCAPSSSLMPHSVTMWRARLVACCRSLRAPEVTASRPNMTSSATLPPIHTSMRAIICRLLWLNSSLSGSCKPEMERCACLLSFFAVLAAYST